MERRLSTLESRLAQEPPTSYTLQKATDIDEMLTQLGTLLEQVRDMDSILKVTDRWLKAYALKTKQDPGDGDAGSKFGARK